MHIPVYCNPFRAVKLPHLLLRRMPEVTNMVMGSEFAFYRVDVSGEVDFPKRVKTDPSTTSHRKPGGLLDLVCLPGNRSHGSEAYNGGHGGIAACD